MTDYQSTETPLQPRPRAQEASQAPAPASRRRLDLGWHRRLGPPALRAAPVPRQAARSTTAAAGGGSGPGGAASAADTALRRPPSLDGGGKGNSEEPEPQGRCSPAGPRGHGRLHRAAAASEYRARLTERLLIHCPRGKERGPPTRYREAAVPRHPSPSLTLG